MSITIFKRSTCLKLLIAIIWTILFCLLLRRDVFISTVDIKELQTLNQAESQEY